MDKLKALNELLASKKELLANTDDAERQASLTEDILDLSRQIGAEEARVEAEEKAKESEREEAKQTAAKTKTVKEPKIEVVSGDRYKGFRIKKQVAALQTPGNGNDLPKSVIDKFARDPKSAENMAKMWLDLIDHAYARSQSPAAVKAAMEEETDSEGGYLVFPEYRAELLSYVREQSIALQDCRVINMSSDVMYIPAEDGTVSVAITAEESDATESEPTFTQVTLTAKRHDAYAVASNELLQDQSIPGGIVAVLMSQFNEAIGQKIDSAVFQCDGDPVSGVFLSAGNSVVFDSGSTAFSELQLSDIREVVSQIRTSRLAGSKFYCHRTPAWTLLYGLEDDNGRPYFIESMNQAVPHMLYGYPLRMPEQCPSASAADTALLVFGNLKGFMIGERLGNIDMLVDPYTSGKAYQTNFYIFTRWAYAHALNEYYTRIVTAGS